MSCSKCKKKDVCFIINTFEETRNKVYPWWEPRLEVLWDFVGKHCERFDPILDL